MSLTSDPGTWLPQGQLTWITVDCVQACINKCIIQILLWDQVKWENLAAQQQLTTDCKIAQGHPPSAGKIQNSLVHVQSHCGTISSHRFLEPDPVSLFLPKQCDGSAAADMHKGGQEQLIFEECQPTLSGYLVNDGTVEDLNLQTHHYCSKP